MSVFRAYDIRAVFEKELTLDVCKDIGHAAGSFINGKVCIGYDTRSSSPKIAETVSRALSETGCEVINLGLVSGPIVYFYAFKNKMTGCYITASHNPSEYNGMKFIRPNGLSFTSEYKAIEEIMIKKKFNFKNGKTKDDKRATEEYLKFLLERIKVEKPLKIVIECFNGSGALITPDFFEKFNIKAVMLNNTPKGDFGGLRPEPKGENLALLKKTVVEEKADFGIACDGDADRGVFVDDKGRELNGSILGYVLLENAFKEKTGNVVATIDCASELEDLAKKMNKKIVWSRVGHGFIEECVSANNAIFGVEQSSHLYPNTLYPFSDSTAEALIMAETLAKNNIRLSKVIDGIKMHPIEKMYINSGTHELKEKAMQNIRKLLPEGKDFIDGIKLKLNEVEWVLIRISQTMPEINLCIEAEDNARLKELTEKYHKIITDTIQAP